MSNDIEIVHFGLDFLRFRCPLEYPLVSVFAVSLARLDSDNSSYGTVSLGDVDFYAVRSGSRYILRPADGSVAHPVIRFGLCGGGMGEFDIYSSFFNWDDGSYLSFLAKLPHRLTRVDVACDFKGISVVAFVEGKIDTDLKRTYWNKTDNGVETVYIGDMKSKRKVIRVYDKKLDSVKKRKTEFYPSYFASPLPFTRYEIELRNQACQRHMLDIRKVMDSEYLYFLFYNESRTNHVFIKDLPNLISEHLSAPKLERGIPDPVLRFREAILLAQKKGIDVLSEVHVWCGQSV